MNMPFMYNVYVRKLYIYLCVFVNLCVNIWMQVYLRRLGSIVILTGREISLLQLLQRVTIWRVIQCEQFKCTIVYKYCKLVLSWPLNCKQIFNKKKKHIYGRYCKVYHLLCANVVQNIVYRYWTEYCRLNVLPTAV